MSGVYQIVTDRIVELLEQGTIPWRKPWRSSGVPVNLVSGREYRGINVWLLMAQNHSSPHWLTFRQATSLGGHIKRGEKGTLVVFWKRHQLAKAAPDSTTDEPRIEIVPLLRYYRVFNTEQCDLPKGTVPESEVREFRPVDAAADIVENFRDGPEIVLVGDRAFYSPERDLVQVPQPETFESTEAFYQTIFHELSHSTGHPKRLNRPGIFGPATFGSPEYAREELVAEMGAAFLAAHAGLRTGLEPADSAAYIANWLQALRNDRTLVVKAASAAQKAADHILGREYSKADSGTPRPEAVMA